MERPALHFMPATGWMNDPNGLVYHDGEWHLFFQHNPSGDGWANISWGHAVSTDLVHWEQLGTAIGPEGGELPFSGSVVAVGDRLVAVYTAARPGHQAQALASSTDGGRTFRREGVVLDVGSADFRDPKVFRHHGGWVMVVALSVERRLRFYGSPDLREWTLLSEFDSGAVPGGVWECPDLFPLGGRWVLVVSVEPSTWYFVGDFDGARFVAERCERLDHGADFYAGVTWNDAPRRVLIGWMNNWTYARGRPWRSAMSIPRELTLVDGRIVQRPVVAGDVYELDAGDVVTLPSATVGYDGARLVVEREGPPWFAGRSSAPVAGDGPLAVEILVDHGLVEVFAGAVAISVQALPGTPG